MAPQAVLTLNAGSSSIKFALFAEDFDQAILSGLVDRIGVEGLIRVSDAKGQPLQVQQGGLDSHELAFARIIDCLGLEKYGLGLSAVGHRVVHGGKDFALPALIDDQLLEALGQLVPF
nr:acetate kinase [Betaproteobacteria bacterium]